jgi:hypothetical protein
VGNPVNKLIVDPEGRGMYALLAEKNSLLAFELPDLGEAGEVFVGTNPVDFDYDPRRRKAIVALASPPRIAVVDLERMEEVRSRTTQTRVHAIRWLDGGTAVVVREEVLKGDAFVPELTVLRVSLMNASSGRVTCDLRNDVFRSEVEEARKKIDELTRRVRFVDPMEVQKVRIVLAAWRRRMKELETSFLFPAIGIWPARRRVLAVEIGPEGDGFMFEAGRTKSRFEGKATFCVAPLKERSYSSSLAIHFSEKGGRCAAGTGLFDLRARRSIGQIKWVAWVLERNRSLCNIFALNADATRAFSGTHVFDLDTFVPIARLPFMSPVLALGPEERILYAYDRRAGAIVGVSIEKILKAGMGAAPPPPPRPQE